MQRCKASRNVALEHLQLPPLRWFTDDHRVAWRNASTCTAAPWPFGALFLSLSFALTHDSSAEDVWIHLNLGYICIVLYNTFICLKVYQSGFLYCFINKKWSTVKYWVKPGWPTGQQRKRSATSTLHVSLLEMLSILWPPPPIIPLLCPSISPELARKQFGPLGQLNVDPTLQPRPDSIDGLGAITQARLPPAVYLPQCRGTKFVIVPNTTKNKRCSSNSPMSMTGCSALWRLWTNEDSQWMNSPLTCREQLSSGRRGEELIW